MTLCAAGLGAAKVATGLYGTPIMPKVSGPKNVSGVIERVEFLEEGDGSRVLLRNLVIEGVAPEDTPKLVRLRFRKDEGLVPGARIETLAKIDAPSRAVLPGAYDFRRHLFFEGIGGVGFSYKSAAVVGDAVGGADLLFENTRNVIERKISEHAGRVSAGIMSALITGQRGAIADEDDDAMRDSGLYHLLSISGTHVTMVAGVIFFFIRFALACFPYAALHWPIKKIAAAASLFGAAFYVLLAGAEVPAMRALLMTGLIMVAVMLDRSPFSLRLIAFAALAVLIMSPQALMGVSFQMSFAAVAAMICFYEYIRPWWMGWHARAGFVRRCVLYVIGIVITSAIAGCVTGIFSLYHFQAFQIYGVLSNMMAVPITGFVVMPAAVLAVVLMPFGLEALPLKAMEEGTLWMLAVAHWAARLDGAVINVGQWPLATLVFCSIGLTLFMLWRGWRGKGVAAFVVLCGFLIAAFSPSPEIMVSDTGKLFGVRGADGALYVSSRRGERFTIENWQRLSGHADGVPLLFSNRDSGVRCDADGCRIGRDGWKVSIVHTPKAYREDCAWADLILSDIPLRKIRGCNSGAVRFDLFDFRRGGAHAFYFGKDRISVRKVSGDTLRPWD
ncbi:MAG: hypothetical protein DI626_11550 [Micavibrio aeruginosavorus]|uniref:Uncharacterized protein n=1 Tax=Micavibrio aeruginosavorus TaxID=349221 RepID=A0A2W4ZDQ6_9BACT|nr:MAG: hypothetical protein DI626_11550 [Micavibrio aeruginosavorus]